MSQKYFILSLKWSPAADGRAVWWAPNNAGYTTDLNRAGLYTEEQIESNKAYYDNSVTTQAWREENTKHHAKVIPAILVANYNALKVAAASETEKEAA